MSIILTKRKEIYPLIKVQIPGLIENLPHNTEPVPPSMSKTSLSLSNNLTLRNVENSLKAGKSPVTVLNKSNETERKEILSFNGVKSLKINENILRAETAAISMISILTFELLS